MRACLTGVFGSCLLPCAPKNLRHPLPRTNNCASSLESEHESGLTQREYCERHGLSLKNFGNWRAQLKREDAVGPKARWGRYPRLRPMTSPMTKARTKASPENFSARLLRQRSRQ
jgi:hypothetical protein